MRSALLDSLSSISALATSSSDEDSFYYSAIEQIALATDADCVAVHLYSTRDQCLTVRASCQKGSSVLRSGITTIPVEIGRIRSVVDGGEIILFDGLKPDPGDFCRSYMKYGYMLGISMPIRADNEILGVVTLLFSHRDVEQDIEFLLALENVLGAAMRLVEMRSSNSNACSSCSCKESIDRLERTLRQSLPTTYFAEMESEFSPDAREGARESAYGEKLTARERRLLCLIADGLSNDEICHQLYLSESTVKKRISSLLRKIGVENRVQAVSYAFRGGYVA